MTSREKLFAIAGLALGLVVASGAYYAWKPEPAASASPQPASAAPVDHSAHAAAVAKSG